jgi:hypothetical protein
LILLILILISGTITAQPVQSNIGVHESVIVSDYSQTRAKRMAAAPMHTAAPNTKVIMYASSSYTDVYYINNTTKLVTMQHIVYRDSLTANKFAYKLNTWSGAKRISESSWRIPFNGKMITVVKTRLPYNGIFRYGYAYHDLPVR